MSSYKIFFISGFASFDVVWNDAKIALTLNKLVINYTIPEH